MSDSMRSLNSFGAAGLLDQKCDVFYSNELRVRNLGRVSDLVSARLRETNVDELRLRALMTFGVFSAYSVRGIENHHREDVPPVSVEIGMDPVHVVVALTFHWENGAEPKWKGLEVRVDSGSGTDAFEKNLESIARLSSQLIVRHESTDRRIEIVALIHRQKADLRDPTMVVSVNSKSAPLLEVGSYVEIGDLNFGKLLRNPVASESAVDGRTPQQTLEEVRIPASAGGEEDLRALREEHEVEVSELKSKIQELKERLEESEARASERRFSTGGGSVSDETPILVRGKPEGDEKKDDWGFHFLKQVWPFAAKDEGAEKEEAENVEAESTRISGEPPGGEEEVVIVSDPSDPEEGESETARAATKALRDLQELAKPRKSERIEATLKEIEEDAEADKAKRWVDNLSSELLQEKAKLNELQRNLSLQMRQRELEFKTAERALKQELKRKDEAIAQRQSAIENKNEQIAQLNLAVERASASTNEKETLQLKSKLDRAQRLSQMKEEEARTLVTKVRDLENRLIIAQAKAQKGNDLQAAAKVQNLEKKVEEYKRVNQRLMESLNSQKDRSSDKEVGDLRRKIDQLDRLHAESKRNLDKSAFKLRELQESERKLQSDLARALEENRSLRKNQGRGGADSGGGGQAAA